MNEKPFPTILVLGASGLIGEALASQLSESGFPIVPVARRFNRRQKAHFGPDAVEIPLIAEDCTALSHVIAERNVDIVVNCIGVLQDSRRGGTDAVHRDFVERLVQLLGSRGGTWLLIHLSIPDSGEDRTPFSRTKRQAERLIAASAMPFVILRPGFVVASAAYGGSALMRALAVLPFDFPRSVAARPFAVTDVADLVRTVAVIGDRWRDGERQWNAIWDVMAREATTVSNVLNAFRCRLGGPERRWALPSWLMMLGAKSGDLTAWLGWSPPMCSTALAEMRRGVAGDPVPWITATGIEPATLAVAMRAVPSTVQEKWFGRLYLAKALVLASLVVFWCLSGLIALTIAFNAAAQILTAHGIAPPLAAAITVVSSTTDVLVGAAIAIRRTCRWGLLAGIGVSLFYIAGAAILTPDLWVEPLGALVKTVPAIVLMLVALAMLDDR